VQHMDVPTFEIDLRRRTLSTRLSTAHVATIPMPSGMLEMDTNIERVRMSPGSNELAIGLPGGEVAYVELRETRRPVSELRAGRPVVYLDQNHWSAIAAARFGHGTVSRDEARAADCLIELVEAKEILLPVSGAHLVETTPQYGQRRIALATTVLQLGRGWQMRNPVHVRVDEILSLIQGRQRVAADVFAPQADRIFSSSEASFEVVTEVDQRFEDLIARVPQILGLYDAVVDPEAIPDEGGDAAAAAWAAKFAGLAVQLHAAGESAEMVRRVANGNLLVDLLDDVMRVALLAKITPEEVINRLTTPDDPVSRMPFLAQMRQLLFARLRNKTQKWEANDLMDILFLTCAAGYADIVVAERTTITYLRQASTPRPKARLAKSLTDAVTLLSEVKC